MNAVISPLMQHDFVTKKEFGEFRSEVSGRFDDLKGEMSEFKDEIRDGFTAFKTEIQGSFRKLSDEIKDDMGRYVGILNEQNKHNLAASVEYLKDFVKK